MVDGVKLDEQGLWRAIKSTLESMVVAREVRNVVDEFRKLSNLQEETYLEFLTRARLLFRATRQLEGERECVPILFEKLTT